MDPSTPATTQTVQPTGQKTMSSYLKPIPPRPRCRRRSAQAHLDVRIVDLIEPVGAPELTAEEQKKREWGVDLDVDGQPMVGKKQGVSVGCCIGWVSPLSRRVGTRLIRQS